MRRPKEYVVEFLVEVATQIPGIDAAVRRIALFGRSTGWHIALLCGT